MEVMLCVAILVGLLVGLISLYVYCFDLQETSSNTSNALFQMQAKLEEIKNADFAQIVTYDEQTYDLMGTNSQPIGQIYVEVSDCQYPLGADAQNCQLYNLRIIAGWVQRAGRIIGEGKVDSESGKFVFDDDKPYGDGDGILESTAELNTSIAKKE